MIFLYNAIKLFLKPLKGSFFIIFAQARPETSHTFCNRVCAACSFACVLSGPPRKACECRHSFSEEGWGFVIRALCDAFFEHILELKSTILNKVADLSRLALGTPVT